MKELQNAGLESTDFLRSYTMKKNLLTFRIFLKALSLSGLSIKWITAKSIDRFKTKTAHFGNQQDAKEWEKDDYLVESFDIVGKSMLMGKLKLILK